MKRTMDPERLLRAYYSDELAREAAKRPPMKALPGSKAATPDHRSRSGSLGCILLAAASLAFIVASPQLAKPRAFEPVGLQHFVNAMVEAAQRIGVLDPFQAPHTFPDDNGGA